MRTDVNTDEKFVTIDYETWETKYKPFDQKIKDLEWEIERLRDNDIRLIVRGDRYYWHFGASVGIVHITADGGYSIKGFDKEGFLRVIEDELRIPVSGIKETNELLEKLYEAHRKAMALPRLVRWILGIKG